MNINFDSSISIDRLARELTLIDSIHSPGSEQFQIEVENLTKQLRNSITYEVVEDEHGKTTKAFVQVQVEVPNV